MLSSSTLAKTMTAVFLLSQCQSSTAAMKTSQMIAAQLKPSFQRHRESQSFTSSHYTEMSPKPSRKSLLDSFPESTITRIKMIAPKPEPAFVSDQKTIQKLRSKTRTNSRFLRTFPPLELYKYAKRAGSNNDIDDQEDNRKILLGNPNKIRARLENGNSPVFYIRLPPAPYVYVPGIGYVSPHPYSHGPQFGGHMAGMMPFGIPAGPVMMTAGSPMMGLGGGGGFMLPSMDQDISTEQPTQNVISLPLKFLSNGRPHQIESPKKKKPPKQENSSEQAAVISGGKYSFNGRPTAVFVVRSPAGGSMDPDLSEMTMILPQK